MHRQTFREERPERARISEYAAYGFGWSPAWRPRLTAGHTTAERGEAVSNQKIGDKMMTERPPLDSWRFDAIVSGPERLWGLEAIAQAMSVSVATVRRLAKRPDTPIYRPDGTRYFALRSELNQWLRTK